MDLAQAFASPEVIDFGGRELAVRQLRLQEWGELQAWLKRAVPSPLTQALKTLTEAEAFGIEVGDAARRSLLDHAQEAAKAWPPPVGSVRWLAAVDSAPGGSEHFLRYVLGRAGTAVTEDEAAALAAAATPADWRELTRASYFGDPPDPKARAVRAPTTTATTPPTPTTGPGPTPGDACSTS